MQPNQCGSAWWLRLPGCTAVCLGGRAERAGRYFRGQDSGVSERKTGKRSKAEGALGAGRAALVGRGARGKMRRKDGTCTAHSVRSRLRSFSFAKKKLSPRPSMKPVDLLAGPQDE